MKYLTVLLLLGLALGGCGCGSSDDSTSGGTSSMKPADSSNEPGASDGVSSQVRKIGTVKKN